MEDSIKVVFSHSIFFFSFFKMKQHKDSARILCRDIIFETRTCFLFLLFVQCCQLLAALGIPTLVANGEAEALCALLNKEGVS